MTRWMKRFSIGTKVWTIVGLLVLMSLLAVGLSVRGIRQTQALGLAELEEAMLDGHRAKLKAAVEAQAFAAAAAMQAAGADEAGRRAALAAALADVRFPMFTDEPELSGYFFAYDQAGVCVASPTQRESEGVTFWDVRDTDGVYLFREMAERSKAGGGFVAYRWSKPGSDAPAPKISYARFIPGTTIMLGTGVYVDDVQEHLDAIHTQMSAHQTTLFTQLAVVMGLFAGVIVAPLTIAVVRFGVTRPLGRLAEGLERIGDGDLTIRVDESGGDEVAALGHSVNRMTEATAALIGDVISACGEVAGASTEIAAAAEQMACGTREQSAQITQVAAAITEMSASVTEVAGKSQSAARAAESSGRTAEEGGTVVQQTITGMNQINDAVSTGAQSVRELGKRGEQIGAIVDVIKDIADQTNLLALNAAIEAARAGEHGRGFAVVADEVRKLADRTTQATDEITQSIGAIQTETGTAVERMNAGTEQVRLGVEKATAASTALGQIVGSARNVSGLVQSIAAAAEQQSAASEEISRTVESIDQLSGESARAVEQSAAAAAQLSRKAEQLRAMVERFKLAA